jgi:3-oxoacyl-[acyl-carrier-protein] synthase II
MKRRVVITGMGALTALGVGTENLWRSIRNGKSGITRIERINVSDLPTQIGAEIRDFDANAFVEKKELKRMERFAQYALVATELAIKDSRLDFDTINRKRTGVIIGSGIGGIETIEKQQNVLVEKGADRVSPFFVPLMLPNMANGLVSIKYGIKVGTWGQVPCPSTFLS